MFGFLKRRNEKPVSAPPQEPVKVVRAAEAPDLSLLVPVIKVVELDAPSAKVIEVPHGESPVVRPFAADLVVMYALDLPTHFQFLSYRDLQAADISEDDLHRLALQNLPTRLPEVKVHGQAPRYMVTAGGNFEATLLLLDSMWEQFAEQMPGELWAVAPARDLLYVSASGWEGALTFLREMANIDLPEKRYALSTCIFARRGGKWQPHALVA